MKLVLKILHVNLSDRESIDVKAVVNHYENSHEIIIPRNCHMIDRSSNERSIKVYRLTARKICKQSIRTNYYQVTPLKNCPITN